MDNTVTSSAENESQEKTRQLQLLKIQKLMQSGQFAPALEQLEIILKEDENFVDALYMKAACLRYLKRPKLAFETLEALTSLVPEFGRAFQEEGHLYRGAGEKEKALNAFKAACQFNPVLAASWMAQAELLRDLNHKEEEIQAALAQVERIKKLPREVVAATHFLSEKRLLKAENLCRHYLKSNPKNTDAMRLLAEIAENFGAMEEAEFLLESAVEFEPERVQLRLDYLQILRRRQKLQDAYEQADYLYKRDSDNTTFQAQMAICHMQLGDYEKSISLFKQVKAKEPNNFSNMTSLGHALKTSGDLQNGIENYRQAYEVQQTHGEAYFSLANLKTYEFTDAEMAQMKAQVASKDLTYRDRIHFLFALGKAHEDRKYYEQAFEYYEQANDLGRKQMRYDADKMSTGLAGQIEVCTSALFEAQSGKGCLAPDPIFIVGLPRAGSTLLEQIIASHSQVDGTQELGNILSLAHKLRGRGRTLETSQYPKILHGLSSEKLIALGQTFIEETQIHRNEAPFFIDKMPNNFRHIGLINLILPNAKIIDARRHPMACCFSGFKQHFAEGQEFTYGLKQVGKYYRDYVALMDHWDNVLPNKVLRVQYEDVVANTETQVRRILDYLDLPFEQACVDFHKTKRSVRTPSSEQVRQPIFKSGLEQWRNFEPWLDPLKEALGPEILKRYPI